MEETAFRGVRHEIDARECALGVIMEQDGCDVETARSRLANLSRDAGVGDYCTASWLIKYAADAAGRQAATPFVGATPDADRAGSGGSAPGGAPTP